MAAEIREQVQGLIAQVEQGRILDAFERYYAEDVTMQENGGAPTVGKAANRERERQFVASVAEVHENRAKSAVVDGDRAVIEWAFEFTNREGARLRLNQVAAQTWKDGRIVAERFYYDTASVLVSAN